MNQYTNEFSPAVIYSARRRIALRLLPFVWFLYIIAFLDRANVAYAALEMPRDLGFSDRVFGLGAGIFFIGYFLLEIPGAILVERWSARKWIARIMISWGLVTVLVGFVHTASQFYLTRFLLGAAEAGFYPGIIIYLTHWFTQQDRAKAVALFMTATSFSNVFGSPLAGQILKVHWLGLAGWRWLFILEGVPAVIFGVVTIFYLTDWPHQAHWLPKQECDWITAEVEQEKRRKNALQHFTIWQALRNRDVLLLAAIYFMGSTGFYGFVMWLPTILKRASGLSTTNVTLLSSVAYAVALTAVLLNGWHSDKTQERRWHSAVLLFGAGAFLILMMAAGSHIWLQFACLVIFGACIHSYMPSFWALPTSFLGESAAAASVGFINSVGGLGGFVGPAIIGYLSSRTNSFVYGFVWLVVNVFLAGILILCLRRHTAAPITPELKAMAQTV